VRIGVGFDGVGMPHLVTDFHAEAEKLLCSD